MNYNSIKSISVTLNNYNAIKLVTLNYQIALRLNSVNARQGQHPVWHH